MRCSRRIALSAALVLSATVAQAQTLVVANKSDDTVDLVSIDSGESRATLATGHAPHEVAVSADGSRAIVTNYGDRQQPGASLTILDLKGRRAVKTIDLGEHRRPHGVAWIGEQRIAVTTEGSQHLLVVDVAEGKITAAIPTGQRISHMLAVTPDGSRAFVANIGSGSVTVVDLASGEKVRDVVTGEGAEGIAVTPDGKHVWVGNRAADTISIVDTDSLEIVAELPCKGFPIRVAITPDGKRALLSLAATGEVALFDVAGRKELRRSKLDLSALPGSEKRLFGDRFGDSPVPVGLVISPDGAQAWVAATQSDVVVAFETETLKVNGLLKAGHEPDGMAYASIDIPPGD